MFVSPELRHAIFVGLALVNALPSGASVALAQGRSPQSRGQGLSGGWQLWGRYVGVDVPNRRLMLETRGDSVFATSNDGMKLAGVASGDSVILRGNINGVTEVTLLARWRADSLVGTSRFGTQSASPAFLVRDPQRPAGAPTRHLFRPARFHHAFGVISPPALRIFSGDTVTTETIDASGRDSIAQQRALGGNPLTGPFWIEGSMPGDVVVVHLLRVRTNRTIAFSGAALFPVSTTPAYFRQRGASEDGGSVWTIDAAAQTVRPNNPTEALRTYSVPLRPMLGCIGVAPGLVGHFEAVSSRLPGSHGGNLDYNRVVEGTSISFQVSQPGTFLFLGDGHAAQGDGELLGAGLETSLTVEFSIELVRDKDIGFPRVEDATHLMSIGVGGSLDRAFQVATTHLARWIEADYKLSRRDVALVLGTSIQYDVAEVVNGDFNVVAKLPKAVLRTIGNRNQ